MWHSPLLSQFDPDNTGYISTEKFRSLLQRHGSELDPHKLEVLLALADSNSEGRICYQDFVNLVSALACQSLALLKAWTVKGQCLSLSFPLLTPAFAISHSAFCIQWWLNASARVKLFLIFPGKQICMGRNCESCSKTMKQWLLVV